jgi:hypothetical protein
LRSGDTVRHYPTNEVWLLAWADANRVSPCGWPETIALVKDCVLVEACSDIESAEMIKQWAEKEGSDYRISRCRELLSAMTPQAASAGEEER